MCFGGGNQKITAQQAEQQAAADDKLEQERNKVSKAKARTLEEAISAQGYNTASRQGGSSRRSLFTSPSGGRGFFSKFG